DRAVTMIRCMWGLSGFSFFPNSRVCLLNHLLAKVDTHKVVLKNVVIKHVLGCFAEVCNPLRNCGRSHAEGHVLRVAGANRVVVAADSADPAGYKMCIPRILSLHENAVAAKDRGGAV